VTTEQDQHLILLHGALGAASQFSDLREALRALDGDRLRIHAMDFEGHGAAASGDRPFRMAHFAENVLDHLDRHRIDRAAIFGYSMGGYVGVRFAATHPGRVDRVMTLGTKFRWTPEVADREARMLDPRRMEEKVPQFARALAARHTGAGWEAVLEQTREMMHALGTASELPDDLLSGIAVPVRIAVGDRDATVTVEESAAVSRTMPAGELEVLPGTPHPLERVSRERLARSIGEFARTG
jgi:pimeloyl-ACP methyl ester carboxylesterase